MTAATACPGATSDREASEEFRCSQSSPPCTPASPSTRPRCSARRSGTSRRFRRRPGSSVSRCAGFAHDLARGPGAPAAQAARNSPDPAPVAPPCAPRALGGAPVRPGEHPVSRPLAVPVLADVDHALAVPVGPRAIARAVRVLRPHLWGFDPEPLALAHTSDSCRNALSRSPTWRG